jgi:hypothetical protein
MQVNATIVINSFEIETQGRQSAKVKAAFKIGNMPAGMNPFNCSIQLSEKARQLIDELLLELAAGVGEKISEEDNHGNNSINFR